METRILNPVKVALALATLALFGFAPAAWGDDGKRMPVGVQAVTGADRSAVSAAPSSEAEPDSQQQVKRQGDVPGASSVGSPDHEGETSGDRSAARPDGPAAIAGPDASSEPQAAASEPQAAASEPQAAAKTTGREAARKPAAASTTVVPETATPPSVSQTTSTSTGIPAALQEAILQASGRQPSGSGGGNEGTLAAESNATTQLIWQVQISECVAHCAGVMQYQMAAQQNSTHQVLVAAPAGGGASQEEEPAASERSQASVRPTQIQLGCLAHCSGATTTSATGALDAAYLQLLQQVLDKVLQELLGAIAAALPGPSPAPAVQENTVAQVSYQSQSAPGPVLAQTQSVEQASSSEQLHDPSSALVASLQKALGGQAAASAEAVNQTEQGIWQLQIGCLFFCEETVQYQQAAQSNTTVQTIEPVSGTTSSAAASVANLTTQLIWQAQIGCLLWCANTTQLQIATSVNTLLASERRPPDVPPSPAGSPTLAPPGNKPAAPPPAPGSSPSGGGGASPASGSGASTPLPASTGAGVQDASLPSVMPSTSAARGRAVAPEARRAVLPAAVTAPLRAQPAVRAQVIALPASTGGDAGSRVAAHAAARPPAASGMGAAAALGPAEEAGSNVPAAVLVAAIALFALVALRVALRARRG